MLVKDLNHSNKLVFTAKHEIIKSPRGYIDFFHKHKVTYLLREGERGIKTPVKDISFFVRESK